LNTAYFDFQTDTFWWNQDVKATINLKRLLLFLAI